MSLRKNIRTKNAVAPSRRRASRQKGAELVELAFVLPFFLLMIIGIVDFGGAWAGKDEITGSARDGARVAASTFNDMTNPQCGGASCTAQAAVDAVVAAVGNAGLPTCGLTGAGLGAGPQAFSWTGSSPCPNGGTFTVTVARAVPEVDGSSGTNVNVLTTQVTVNYPYTLLFAMPGAFMFGGGTTFANFIPINSMATMVNSN